MSGKDLKTVVAELAGADPAAIDASFSLQGEAFSSSIKKAALVASIRRHLGVDCMQAAFAKSYGELEAMIAASRARQRG
ncbi:MAG: hypothetical protein ACHQ49_17380 [Elusimicrobiota bacterium]